MNKEKEFYYELGVRENLSNINWLTVTANMNVLTEDFIREFQSHILWTHSFVRDWLRVILKQRNLWKEFKHYYE